MWISALRWIFHLNGTLVSIYNVFLSSDYVSSGNNTNDVVSWQMDLSLGCFDQELVDPHDLWLFNGGFSCKSFSKLHTDHIALQRAMAENNEVIMGRGQSLRLMHEYLYYDIPLDFCKHLCPKRLYYILPVLKFQNGFP